MTDINELARRVGVDPTAYPPHYKMYHQEDAVKLVAQARHDALMEAAKYIETINPSYDIKECARQLRKVAQEELK